MGHVSPQMFGIIKKAVAPGFRSALAVWTDGCRKPQKNWLLNLVPFDKLPCENLLGAPLAQEARRWRLVRPPPAHGPPHLGCPGREQQDPPPPPRLGRRSAPNQVLATLLEQNPRVTELRSLPMKAPPPTAGLSGVAQLEGPLLATESCSLKEKGLRLGAMGLEVMGRREAQWTQG